MELQEQAAPESPSTAVLDPRRDLVAYFCAEFAVDPRLPIYAGGLGVLAGDHLKTAADMGLPLVAVGLLYSEGYFTQELDQHGAQHARAARYDPAAAGAALVHDVLGRELRIRVPLAEREAEARVWRKDVGRVPLFLLDANVPENSAADRAITQRLYDASPNPRLQQEILLGIGGVRALRALGLRPSVWHLNEGHAAFVALERAREYIAEGLAFDAAIERAAASVVFTTHTAVPAGHDSFELPTLRQWLRGFLAGLHTNEGRALALGDGGNGRFSMTALALRGSRFRNGVSKIHGGVASRMESYVWPEVPPEHNPIGSITNGVHLPTFLAPVWQGHLDRHVRHWRGRALQEHELDFVNTLSDAEMAALRSQLKHVLLDDLRARLTATHRRLGTPEAQLRQIVSGLDADQHGAPIITFARRFATYKRATLLLRDAPRLAKLLGDPDRPVLLLFAGKAHPHDGPGQDMIRRLFQHSIKPEFIGRLIVLEGYDLDLAGHLVQGSDVWLNTPEYPLEASGTSGMKAGINGGINVSVLDGWWAEGCDGENGFGIEPVAGLTPDERDHEEANRLFDLLESKVLPEYWGPEGAWPSREWLRRVRHSVRTILPRFAATRMLAEYQARCYVPAAQLGRRLDLDQGKGAANLARWKHQVHQHWSSVKLAPQPGEPLRARVATHGLAASHIAVDAVLANGDRARLRLEGSDQAEARYILDGAPPASGIHALRAYPHHELLGHPLEMGLLIEVAV